MVRLGERVRDLITGFAGVATARVEYLNGCVRIEVTPKALHEGKPMDAQWFDEQRIDDGSPVTMLGGPGSISPAPSRPLA